MRLSQPFYIEPLFAPHLPSSRSTRADGVCQRRGICQRRNGTMLISTASASLCVSLVLPRPTAGPRLKGKSPAHWTSARTRLYPHPSGGWGRERATASAPVTGAHHHAASRQCSARSSGSLTDRIYAAGTNDRRRPRYHRRYLSRGDSHSSTVTADAKPASGGAPNAWARPRADAARRHCGHNQERPC